MPRLMSVTHTERAVVERRKDVTRRAGWAFLAPGDELDLCRKVMGRTRVHWNGTERVKVTQPLVRLARVRVLDVRRERLDLIDDWDVRREGFHADDLDEWGLERRPAGNGLPVQGSMAASFVRFFVAHMGGASDQLVTRIEWDFLDTPVVTVECGRPGEAYKLLEHGPRLIVHLARPSAGGGTGGCLCGFDRHAAKVGFSVGGGVTGPGIVHDVCDECANRVDPGRPIRGIHAGLFEKELAHG